MPRAAPLLLLRSVPFREMMLRSLKMFILSKASSVFRFAANSCFHQSIMSTIGILPPSSFGRHAGSTFLHRSGMVTCTWKKRWMKHFEIPYITVNGSCFVILTWSRSFIFLLIIDFPASITYFTADGTCTRCTSLWRIGIDCSPHFIMRRKSVGFQQETCAVVMPLKSPICT